MLQSMGLQRVGLNDNENDQVLHLSRFLLSSFNNSNLHNDQQEVEIVFFFNICHGHGTVLGILEEL